METLILLTKWQNREQEVTVKFDVVGNQEEAKRQLLIYRAEFLQSSIKLIEAVTINGTQLY